MDAVELRAGTTASPGPLRPLSSLILPGLVVALAFAAIAWWSIPALTPQTFVAPPVLSQNRMLELKASRVHMSRIVGLDITASTGGTQVRLVGGYMDAEQIVLFMRMDPPARTVSARTNLRDQFGRSYRIRGQFADLSTGESILYFTAPGFPLLQTGARFTLESSELERTGPQRVPASLSLSAIVLLNDPSVGAYLLDMAINYLVLAVASGAYLIVMLAGALLFRVAAPVRKAFVGGLSSALLVLLVTLPTSVAIASLIRHDPIGPGGFERQRNEYLAAVEAIVFYAIQVGAVAFGVMRTNRIARMRAGRLGFATGVAVLLFLALIQPLAEFANACYVGTGFLLHPSC
jgi:hypothetical protein